MIDFILISLLIVGAILIMISSVLGQIYFKYFKEKYYNLWEQLGRPSFLYESSAESRNRLELFEKNKEYLSLNDKSFSRILLISRFFRKFVDCYAIFFITILFISCFVFGHWYSK